MSDVSTKQGPSADRRGSVDAALQKCAVSAVPSSEGRVWLLDRGGVLQEVGSLHRLHNRLSMSRQSKGGTRAPRLDIACLLMPSRQKNGVSRASSASTFKPHERDGQEEQSSPDTEDLGQRPNFEANVGSEVVCIALAVYR